MAKGLENSTLVQHLDKISYIAAAVIGLVILFIAMQSGTEVKRLQADMSDDVDAINKRKGEKIPEKTVENLRKEIEGQWAIVPARNPYPSWSTERIPAVIQWTMKIDRGFATQEAGQITKIEYHRHTQRLQTFLTIAGKFGVKSKSTFKDVKLFRKEKDKAYKELSGLDEAKAIKEESFVYEDFDVESGKTYAYKFSTEIEGAEGVKIELNFKVVESPEAALAAPIPYDYRLNILNPQPFDPAKGEKPSFIGDIYIANFENEAADPIKLPPQDPARSVFFEGFKFGPKVGKDPQYTIKEITADGVKVQNNRSRTSELLTRSAQHYQREIKLPAAIDFTAPPPPKATEGEAGTETAAATGDQPEAKPEEPKEPKPEPKKPEPKKPDTTKKPEKKKSFK
ncbi:MAG: hypothetical protein HY717_11505 [Planctomycetes bacterium]|nr:hypothetical protein [Planctomycetota bacterium]